MIRFGEPGKIIVPVLFILFLVCFFHFKIYVDFFSVFNRGNYIFLVGVCLFFLFVNIKGLKNSLFPNLFKLYLFFIALNIITCYYFRGQSLWVSLQGWFTFFFLFYYYVFKAWNYTLFDWERVLKIISILLLLGFICQYIFVDFQMFYLDTDFSYLENETRIRIFSDGILSLGGFMFLNKFLINKNKLNLVLYLLVSFILFLQGFRMILLSFSLVSLILCFRILRFSVKYFVFVFILIFSAYLFFQDNEIVKNKIEEILNRNETATFDNEDYVRVSLVNYYYNDFFQNQIEMILGGGRTLRIVDNLEKAPSEYSKLVSSNARNYHYYPVDMGIIGLSWEAGIPFVLVYALIMISIIRTKVPKDYYYLGMWELMLLIASLTQPMLYYHHNIVYQALVLVILHKVVTEFSCDVDNESKVLVQNGRI